MGLQSSSSSSFSASSYYFFLCGRGGEWRGGEGHVTVVWTLLEVGIIGICNAKVEFKILAITNVCTVVCNHCLFSWQLSPRTGAWKM